MFCLFSLTAIPVWISISNFTCNAVSAAQEVFGPYKMQCDLLVKSSVSLINLHYSHYFIIWFTNWEFLFEWMFHTHASLSSTLFLMMLYVAIPRKLFLRSNWNWIFFMLSRNPLIMRCYCVSVDSFTLSCTLSNPMFANHSTFLSVCWTCFASLLRNTTSLSSKSCLKTLLGNNATVFLVVAAS